MANRGDDDDDDDYYDDNGEATVAEIERALAREGGHGGKASCSVPLLSLSAAWKEAEAACANPILMPSTLRHAVHQLPHSLPHPFASAAGFDKRTEPSRTGRQLVPSHVWSEGRVEPVFTIGAAELIERAERDVVHQTAANAPMADEPAAHEPAADESVERESMASENAGVASCSPSSVDGGEKRGVHGGTISGLDGGVEAPAETEHVAKPQTTLQTQAPPPPQQLMQQPTPMEDGPGYRQGIVVEAVSEGMEDGPTIAKPKAAAAVARPALPEVARPPLRPDASLAGMHEQPSAPAPDGFPHWDARFGEWCEEPSSKEGKVRSTLPHPSLPPLPRPSLPPLQPSERDLFCYEKLMFNNLLRPPQAHAGGWANLPPPSDVCAPLRTHLQSDAFQGAVLGLRDVSVLLSPHVMADGSTALYKRFVAACRARPRGTVHIVFHGTADENIEPILRDGLDASRRGANGQAHGPGEYFGTAPWTSLGYCRPSRRDMRANPAGMAGLRAGHGSAWENGGRMLIFAVLLDEHHDGAEMMPPHARPSLAPPPPPPPLVPPQAPQPLLAPLVPPAPRNPPPAPHAPLVAPPHAPHASSRHGRRDEPGRNRALHRGGGIRSSIVVVSESDRQLPLGILHFGGVTDRRVVDQSNLLAHNARHAAQAASKAAEEAEARVREAKDKSNVIQMLIRDEVQV